MTADAEDANLVGWHAIDAALAPLYGAREPKHFAPALPAMVGGNDPLQGISAYRSTFGGTPHWHFVTYGFSELYAKEEGSDPAFSGYGIELTCRVVDTETADDEPPVWVCSMLQNLARYVFRSGNVFEPGHSTPLNGPIAFDRSTILTGALFAADPELPERDTPNGRLTFVQLVGVTDDEREALLSWDIAKLTDLIRATDPALLTRVQRTSYLTNPDFAEAVRAGTERDGSSVGIQFTNRVKLEQQAGQLIFTIGANELAAVTRAVVTRARFGREAKLITQQSGTIALIDAKATSAELGQKASTLSLSRADQEVLVALPVKRGDTVLPSGVVLVRVVPVDIWNGQRTQVICTIG